MDHAAIFDFKASVIQFFAFLPTTLAKLSRNPFFGLRYIKIIFKVI